MEKRGTHGTCFSRRTQIRFTGFRPGGGRGGSGIYFWAMGEYAKRLAEEWFRQEETAGSYRRDQDSKGVVLECAITFEKQEEFLDMEDHQLREGFIQLAKKLDLLSKKDVKSLSKCFDAYLGWLERESGTAIKILALRVAPPRGWELWYPIQYAGAPLCYIARDPSKIGIVKETPI